MSASEMLLSQIITSDAIHDKSNNNLDKNKAFT